MLTNGERDFIASAMTPLDGTGARSEREIDMRGVPMPLCYLRLRRALARLQPGAQLLAAVSDRESLRGLPVLARLCGHDLVEQHEVDGEYFFLFRRR